MASITDALTDPEASRLQALDRYAVLDTPPEVAFDRIADLARALFDTPVALVSFIDQTRQWFKARTGVDVNETSRAIAFCDHAIRQESVMVVNDATNDPRFADNPLVTGAPNIRFYAGAPIRTPDGHNLGTVCVISDIPRTFSALERSRLDALAGIAVHELELRLQATRMRRLAEERSFLLEEVDHRLQNSLHLVSNVLQEQARQDQSPEVRRALMAAADRIVTVAVVCRELRSNNTDDPPDPSDYLRSLCEDLHAAFVDGLGGRQLDLDIPSDLPIPIQQLPRIGFIVSELIGNAVKHGRGAIKLSVRHDGPATQLRITDGGGGFGARHRGPTPEWGAGLRLVQALSGGTLQVDPASLQTLQVTIPDPPTP